jgi:hypothetical protein
LERFALEYRYARQWASFGAWFRANAPADASLTTVAIGAIGYYSGLTIVDPHGLVDAHIAHGKQELGRGYAGHEKFDVQWVLSRRPSYILIVNLLTRVPVPPAAMPQVAWGDFNQQLLRRPELLRAYTYQSVRLDDAYLNLLVRRDLPALGGESVRLPEPLP